MPAAPTKDAVLFLLLILFSTELRSLLSNNVWNVVVVFYSKSARDGVLPRRVNSSPSSGVVNNVFRVSFLAIRAILNNNRHVIASFVKVSRHENRKRCVL